MNPEEKIKSLRLAKGLTQQELSDQSGISLRTIQRIENGEVKPSLYSLKKLSEVLEVDLVGFFKDSEKETFVPNSKHSKTMNGLFSSFTLYRIPLLGSLSLVGLSILTFLFWPNSRPNESQESQNYAFEVATVNCGSETECDIEVTKKDHGGNILWQKTYGGTSYDKASQILPTEDGGCLVLGSTSSFGAGNYDVLLLNIDGSGQLVWQKTYGGFFNEYGEKLKSTSDHNGYVIEGTKQTCPGANVSADCRDFIWTFEINNQGDENGIKTLGDKFD
ncbi:helix-turn-helix domain-containing protein [Aquiflexum gelatinilyticum]|uniref:Helix-turn-helix transcriptional regulator n=1 Tax=Aquiflexum gelatinilyticum TaxID=2961943 RepID=A0A9X2P8G6_9BACT|nr:helix-turn-helix transcriptional regulator [Aquiflexum gelatinilyticum]MCS4434176.1 helix-turn-helix transcriptional regulator [Aquiflexum gelatinilyticum]